MIKEKVSIKPKIKTMSKVFYSPDNKHKRMKRIRICVNLFLFLVYIFAFKEV